MSKLTPPLLLIVASLCFYAGFNVGQKTALKSSVQETSTDETAESSPTVEARPVAVTETADVPTDAASEKVVSDHEHSLRAAQQEITFTDTRGRTLLAEILTADSQSLKIRRIADSAEITLPVAMLCEEDQMFATYLAQQGAAAIPSVKQTEEDKIWEDLFK